MVNTISYMSPIHFISLWWFYYMNHIFYTYCQNISIHRLPTWWSVTTTGVNHEPSEIVCILLHVPAISREESQVFNNFWGKTSSTPHQRLKNTALWSSKISLNFLCTFSVLNPSADCKLCILCMAYPIARGLHRAEQQPTAGVVYLEVKPGDGKWGGPAQETAFQMENRTCLSPKLHLKWHNIRGREDTEENVTMGER